MYGVPFSKDESYTPIREPKSIPITPQSTLSVDAPVFVFNPQHQQQQTQFQQPSHHLEQQQQQQQQQQQHHHHHQQNYGNSHNGYNRNPNYQQQSHSHQYIQHQNNRQPNQYHHNHHHHHHHHQQQQQQQQHHPNQQHYQQQQHQNHHQHGHSHSQQHRMGALENDFQDHVKISNPMGSRSSVHNYNNQVTNYTSRPVSSFPSQQSRLKFHNEPSTSKEAASNDYASSKTQDIETVALDYLSSVMDCLNSNPGQYETIATRFITIFDGLENNQYVLSIAMEEIFTKSTQNPNFRYMGAKLYYLLHMLNLKKDSLFLTLLQCKLDDFKREVCEYMEQSQYGKVCESTLFLAELYMQLRTDDSRIHLLAVSIVFSLKQLLGSESPDNVRCICMTLKLAGYDLTSDCPDEISNIISTLHSIDEKCPGKYPIVASVLALSKENWGRKLSSSASLSESEPNFPEPLRSSDEPIFYGPDGRELTAEETDFLTGGLVSGPAGSTDDDDDADLDELDLEMDEEASKAYKAFCKQSAKS